MTLRFLGSAAAAVLGLSPLFSGCTVGPNFQRPDPKVPPEWSRAAGTATPTPADWWTQFGDPELASLQARAAAANLDLQAAKLRLEQAWAVRTIAGAARVPSLDANAGYLNQRISERAALTSLLSSVSGGAALGGVPSALPFPNPFNQFQYGFDASWEIDLFGRVRRSVEAAGADAEAAMWESRDVLVVLQGDVARVYLDLRDAQAHRRLLEANLKTQRETLELARDRNRTGFSPAIDVANAGAEVSRTEAQIPLETSRITRDIDQLGFLLGQGPSETLRTELSAESAQPAATGPVPIGIPADVARQRPDIRAAEAQLHAATARVGVAVADLFPRVTLNADLGFQAERFTELGSWASRYFAVGPNIDIPVFSGGRRRAAVRLESARAKEAGVAYARAVLVAYVDVETALSAYAQEARRRVALEHTVEQSADVLDLAKERYASGVAGFLDVLDAERTLQQDQLALADSRTAEATDVVVLYKALGGGWKPATDASAPPADTPQRP